jgi:hypothetical protein
VRDAAAYRDAIGGTAAAPGTAEPAADHAPSALAMLAGMLAALLVLGRHLVPAVPGIGRRATAERQDEDQA